MKPKLTIDGERTSVKKFCAHFDVTPEQIERAVKHYTHARDWRHRTDKEFKAKHGVTKSAMRLRNKRKAEAANLKAAEARQNRDLVMRQPS